MKTKKDSLTISNVYERFFMKKQKYRKILAGFALFSMSLLTAPASYAGLNDGLVAYYCFNDANNLGRDCSSNGNDGTTEGTVTAVKGYKGNGALFGGTANPADIHVPNSPSLQFTTELSISYAMKLNSLTGMPGDEFHSSQAVLSKNAGGNESGFAVHALDATYNPGGILTIFQNTNIDEDPTTHLWPHSTSIWYNANAGKWIHVVFTIDTVNKVGKTYHDGKLVNVETIAMDFTRANAQDLYIGKYSDAWFPFNGVIDEVRFYNRVLSDAEVEIISNQGGAINGAVRRFGSHTVTCKNNTTGQIVNIAASVKNAYDCQVKGLIVKPGENVSITINGTAQ